MFARTDRLLLRPAWGEDAQALARAIGDEAIARNLAHVPFPYDVEDARAFVAADRGPDQPAMLIFRRTAGAPQLVGGIGIAAHEEGGSELGYWIARPYSGLGFATEAGRAVIAMARDSLRLGTLKAGHFIDNPASGRVLRKLGFRPTGQLSSRYSAGRGGTVPCVEYALSLADRIRADMGDVADVEAACRQLAA